MNHAALSQLSIAVGKPKMKLRRTVTNLLGIALTAGFAIAGHAQFSMNRIASLALNNGAEINAYDPGTKKLFVVSGSTSVDVVSLADPRQPQLLATIDLAASNSSIGGLNSVSIKNGVAAFAAQGATKQDTGFIVFMATANHSILNTLTAGALPDMVTFSPDGNTLLVANEGEPADNGTPNPEGWVSLIDLTGKQIFNLTQADVTQLSLTGFNDRKEALKARGVRMVFPNATVAQALEPEYIAVTPDNATAFVACQENNAYIVVDIASKTITDILPLGYKDHSRGMPSLVQHNFMNLPSIGVSSAGNTNIALGGLSGLWHAADESFGTEAIFYATPDRGPNGDVVNGNRQFLITNYQARIVKFALDTTDGALAVKDTIFLNRTNSTSTNAITGLPNIPGFDENPVDGNNVQAPYDPYGADLEGIIKAADGTFWMCDEYRPSIYHANANGHLIARYVPINTHQQGTNAASAGDFGQETLPEVYNKRRPNRGFEAIALDTDKNIVYAFIQTPMDNPDSSIRNSDVIRILGINPTNGTPVAEYVYFLERNRDSGHAFTQRVDKLGDAVYAGDNQFYVLERDSSNPNDGFTGRKYVFKIDLSGATNIRATSFIATNNIADVMTGQTLESMTADQVVAMGIRPVFKRKVVNLPSLGYLPSDKPEGLTIVKGGLGDASFPSTPAWGASHSMWDILTINESGPQAGRYLYRAHEINSGAGVSRTDLHTGRNETLFKGDATSGGRDNTDLNAWANDYGALDPVFWTPWGTVLTGEEWSGPGRLIEIGNPEGALSNVTVNVRAAIPFVSHEGLEVDAQGNLYFGDEDNSGSIYKFVPSTPGDLSAGQTFVLKVTGFTGDAAQSYTVANSGNHPRVGAATWVAITDAAGTAQASGMTNNPFSYAGTDAQLRLSSRRPGRLAADEVGGAPYGRPEDFEMGRIRNGKQVLYIAATSEDTVYGVELIDGINARVFVAASPNTANAATKSAMGADFDRVDNLAVDAEGNIYVIEDNSPGDIWLLNDPDGDGVANQAKLWASLATPGSEPTGLYINPLKPDEAFVNVQHPSTGNDITMRIQFQHAGTTLVGLPNGVVRGSLPENAPFKLANGLSQSLLASQDAIDADVTQSAPSTPVWGSARTMWDMLTVNETGSEAGKYLYRAHESATGAGVSRTDLTTGKTETLFMGDQSAGSRDNTDLNAWTNDFGAIDPVFWTPWGTVLSGEEWSGPGRLMEITNPTAAASNIVNVVRPAIPYVSHEGLEVDAAGALYFVDEDHSGSIYKFVPTTWGDLSAGQSFVLKVTAFTGDPAQNWNATTNAGIARTGAATWVAISDAAGTGPATGVTQNPFSYTGTDAQLRLASRRPGRIAADEVGGAPYGRPEDIEMGRLANGNQVLYFCATSEATVYGIELLPNGDARVFVAADRNTVDSVGNTAVGTELTSPDNLAIDHQGQIYVIEDQNPGDIWLMVDPDRDGVANQLTRWASLATPGSEPTGLYINPLKPNEAYVNVQHPGSSNDVTMKITLENANAVTVIGLNQGTTTGALPETAPFSLAPGLTQMVLASQDAIDADATQSAPSTPVWGSARTMWDMLTVNETGSEAGKYLYRAHESATGAGVSRTDLTTGKTETLFMGDQSAGSRDNTDLNAWANDFGAIDPVFWTPWGTVLSGEEWSGPGRLMEITNPTDAASNIVNVVRAAIPYVSHEGLEVDATGALYFVDEDHSGSIYKFVPTTWGDLSAGQSFVLKVTGFAGDAAKNWNDAANTGQSRVGAATWVAISDAAGTGPATGVTQNPFSYTGTDSQLRLASRRPGRIAADEVGGAPYGRPEDIEMGRLANGNQVLYFCATSEATVYGIELLPNGDARVFVAADRTTVDSATLAAVGTELTSPDNLAIDHRGRIYVIEDQNPGDIWLMVDPDRDGIANQLTRWASLATAGSEPTGLYINPLKPDEAFVNVQHPGSSNDMTIKITLTQETPTVVNPLAASATPGSPDLPEHRPFALSSSIQNAEVLASNMRRGPLDAFGNRVDFLAVLNDNDFTADGFPTVGLGIIGWDNGNRFDASNRDNKVGDLKNHPTLGIYQPDSIAFYTGSDNETYVISANEGDAADYSFFSEEARVKDLTLDTNKFPNAAMLQEDANLGRLKTTTANGDLDGDGDVDRIYSYGSRSFTIRDKFGNIVFDSSSALEIITKHQAPHLFNANDGSASEVDDRSDDKGPEPEALTVGTFGTNVLAFVGMERSSGGIAVADVTNPRNVKYLGYFYQDGDIAPEGLSYIKVSDSPTGHALLAVSYEVSKNIVVYELLGSRSRLLNDAETQRLFAHADPGSGDGVRTYQWYKDGAAIANATGANYDAADPGAYHVVVTDANGKAVASETFNITKSKRVYIGGVKIDGPSTGVTFRIEAVDAVGNVISWQTVSGTQDIGDGRHLDLGTEGKNVKFFRVVPVTNP